MKELNIKISGESYLHNAYISIDGKPVKFKRNQFKNFEYRHQTEQDKVKIQICKYADIGGFFWFITQLFFFVISIFGIFDTHAKNKGLCLDYVLDVDLRDEANNLTIRCNPPRENQKAIEIETGLQIEEQNNNYLIAKNAKKKFKTLKISKIICAIAIVVIACVSLIVTMV